MFKKSALDKFILGGGMKWTMLQQPDIKEGHYTMESVEDAFDEAKTELSRQQTAYNLLLKEFRTTIKNDLSSLSASSDRVKGECEKMSNAYRKAQDTLTSPDMERAIVNAERLAAALTAISGLENQSLTFAVIDKKISPP